MDNPLPKEAVCLASGFPLGMGMAGCTCGALAGGIMALGLKYGRRVPNVKTPGMFKAAKKLHDDFHQRFGSTCCRELIKGLELGSPQHIELCAKLTGVTAEMVLRQITQR